jgi:transposase InsO family protein
LVSAFEPRDGDQWDAEMGGDGGQGEVFGLSGSPQIAVVASRNTERQRDLVERMFTRKAPNRLWVTDITGHRTYEGKVYCAVVLDTFSRRVVWLVDRLQPDRSTGHQRIEPHWDHINGDATDHRPSDRQPACSPRNAKKQHLPRKHWS